MYWQSCAHVLNDPHKPLFQYAGQLVMWSQLKSKSGIEKSDTIYALYSLGSMFLYNKVTKLICHKSASDTWSIYYEMCVCLCKTVSPCLNWYQVQTMIKITTPPPPIKSTHFLFLQCCTPFHHFFFNKDLYAVDQD